MCIRKILDWNNKRKHEKRIRTAEEKLQSTREMLEFMLANKNLRRQKYLPTKLTIKAYEMLLEKLK